MAEQVDPVLTDTQNWAARSHPELYAAVHNNNDPGQTGEIGSEWARYGSELTESARIVTERVAATETGWTGTAADGARTALKQLADWLTETAQTAVEVGDRVADQGQVMASARANMPEPVGFTWTDATQNLAAPGLTAFVASAADVQAANDRARSAHAQAVTVMSSMEQSSRAIDVTTPMFTAPFNPVTGKTEEPPMRALQRVQAPALADARGGELTTHAASVGAVREAPAPQGAVAPAPAPAVAGPDSFGERQPVAQKDFTTTASAVPPITPTGGPDPRASMTHTSGTTGQAPVLPPTGPVSTGTRFEPGPRTTSPVYSTGNPVGQGKNGPGPGKGPGTGPGSGPDKFGSGKGIGTNTGPSSGTGPGNGTGPSGGRSGPGGPGGGPGAVPGIGSGSRGGFGGAAAFGGPSGAGSGPMQPGGSTAAIQGNPQAQPGRGPVVSGGTGPGAAAAMGGPMGAGGSRSEEDKEHRSPNYIISGDLFDMPDDNLPPAVIGGAKPKKDKS